MCSEKPCFASSTRLSRPEKPFLASCIRFMRSEKPFSTPSIRFTRHKKTLPKPSIGDICPCVKPANRPQRCRKSRWEAGAHHRGEHSGRLAKLLVHSAQSICQH